MKSPLPLRDTRSELLLPLANECVAAGFPSPADDYLEIGIDLNEHLIQNPASTFFLRVSGYSMINAGIHDGDMLIVDRALDPYPGKIVVAIIDGEFTVKRLIYKNGVLYLEAENTQHTKIDLRQYTETQIWGVATFVIHRLNSPRLSI